MVDRGIQIILNSTTWEKESHTEVYKAMKVSLIHSPPTSLENHGF